MEKPSSNFTVPVAWITEPATDSRFRVRGYIASEVRHDFVFDTQMSLGRETSAEKFGLVMNSVLLTWF